MQGGARIYNHGEKERKRRARKGKYRQKKTNNDWRIYLCGTFQREYVLERNPRREKDVRAANRGGETHVA